MEYVGLYSVLFENARTIVEFHTKNMETHLV